MHLQSVHITNFKNIARATLEFCPKVNCLVGNNGMGKSNLLDAIYALSFARSYSGVPDSLLIKKGEEFAIVSGNYLRHDVDEQVVLGLGGRKRKSLRRSGKEYKKLSDHIGLFPLVMVSPQDADLVRGTADDRRRWADVVISQSHPDYLQNLITYTRSLEQRNRLLRDHCTDPDMMHAVETQLCAAALPVAQGRQECMQQLQALFSPIYQSISGEAEQVTMQYHSEVLTSDLSMQEILERNRTRDQYMGYTTSGPHRDDIDMTIDSMPMRRLGSQGQCKTFTISLRLAQYELMHRTLGMRPMLLLDDIFDRLDASRVERIIEMVSGDSFGQIFVTDTNRTHLDAIMQRSSGDFKMWEVQSGNFNPKSV